MQTATAEKPSTAVQPAQASLVTKVASRFGVDSTKMVATLKATAFRQRADKKTGEAREPTNEEMMGLLIIADQYGLNPFTKELYAFMDPKSGAIIPIVSVDGWIRIINERPELRSLSFSQSAETHPHKGKVVHEWMECEIVRSDRDKPIVIREYFGEVVRITDYGTPWDSHPNRMHRHKTLIQCARVAFGFGGIYDDDEAQRIIEGTSSRVPETPAAIGSINKAIKGDAGRTIDAEPPAASDSAASNEVGKQEAADYAGLDEHMLPALSYAEIATAINQATTSEACDKAEVLAKEHQHVKHRGELLDLVKARRIELA